MNSLIPFYFLLGFLFSIELLYSKHANKLLLLSLPIGICIWHISCIFFMALNIELTVLPIMLLTLSLLFLSHFRTIYLLLKAESLQIITFLKACLPYVFFLGGLFFVVGIVDVFILTGDSLFIMDMSYRISENRSLSSDFNSVYTWAWPLYIPLSSFLVETVNMESFPKVQIGISFSLVCFIASVLYTYAKESINSAKLAGLFLLSSLVCFLSPELVQFNLFYVNSHLAVVSYFFILLYVVLNAGVLSAAVKTKLFLIALIGISLSRIEGPIVALMAYLFFYNDLKLTESEQRKLITLFFLFQEIYLVFLLANGEQGGAAVINAIHLIGLMGIYFSLFIVVFYFQTSHFYKNNVRYLKSILYFGGLFAVMVGFIIKADHMLESLQNIITNLFLGKGTWGAAWWFTFAAIVLFRIVNKPSKELKIILSFSGLYILFVYALTVLHYMPFRTGFGDSANRMMMHVYPLLFVYAIHEVLQVYQKLKHSI